MLLECNPLGQVEGNDQRGVVEASVEPNRGGGANVGLEVLDHNVQEVATVVEENCNEGGDSGQDPGEGNNDGTKEPGDVHQIDEDIIPLARGPIGDDAEETKEDAEDGQAKDGQNGAHADRLVLLDFIVERVNLHIKSVDSLVQVLDLIDGFVDGILEGVLLFDEG